MASTPYNTTDTIVKYSDLTAVSILAGSTYAEADLVNIKAKLTEYDALFAAMGAAANKVS